MAYYQNEKRMFKRIILPLLFLPMLTGAKAPILSDESKVYVVTCGPYQGELYSAFGHSAIRIYDPVNAYDVIYNYGVFDFNQPNFYLNFAKGYLNYQLARAPYQRFISPYIQENRFVHEQEINLRRDQRQRVFDFLENNAQPENRNYYYDYFYNNCATKIRDSFKAIFGDSLVFNDDHINTNYSVRDLTDLYLQDQAWGDLGIDLCLGYPIDKKVGASVYMFLPDYVEQGFNNAFIISKEGREEALVKRTINTFDPGPIELEKSWNTPLLWFSLILIIALILSYKSPLRFKRFRIFDILLFGIVGLIGLFLSLLWGLTDHATAAYNMNILWAFPIHFIIAILMCWPRKFGFLAKYFKISFWAYLLVLISWYFLPQNLNDDFLPLIILLAFRSFKLSKILRKEN
tara:strand:+ start:847 stop:2055 length:1209 start_codon:yes stop_codon:yes gene_type:complete